MTIQEPDNLRTTRITTLIRRDQFQAISNLVEIVGVSIYRDIKKLLDIGAMVAVQNITMLQADILIDGLQQVIKEPTQSQAIAIQIEKERYNTRRPSAPVRGK